MSVMKGIILGTLLLLALAPRATAQGGPLWGSSPEECRQKWSESWRKDDAPGAIEFFQELKVAVGKDDRHSVADMVRYPLRVSGEYRVHNRTAFLRHYDQIFDAKVRKAIESQVPECIFGNWQGFTAGLGDVWFERSVENPTFHIISVNTDSWPKRQKAKQ